MTRVLEKNPKNRFSRVHVEWDEEAPDAGFTVLEEQARSIISENDSPDLHFRFGVNPYRGCSHACAYCYARPYHETLGFGAGTDFERKLVAKMNAPQLLERELAKPRFRGQPIVLSGATDCYQSIERKLRLTRGCLEALAAAKNPVTIITKSVLIERDLDVLQAIHRDAAIEVFLSVPFADEEIARKVEPGVPPPQRRFEAMARISEAGIPTGLSISPIIFGLNDDDVPDLLDRGRRAGATRAFATMVRLPGAVKEVFFERVAEAFPDRVSRIRNAILEMRGGKLSDPRYGDRMAGRGPRWDALMQLFHLHAKKNGFDVTRLTEAVPPVVPQKPAAPSGRRQLSLFGDD